MSKNKIDYAFVESAVSMAKTLGIKTVAEFIENEETLRLVKELDMDYAQGFLLATPQAEFKKTISPHLLKILQTPNNN